jgi:peptidoglycan/LPS O-acetylase OafA/YrhL
LKSRGWVLPWEICWRGSGVTLFFVSSAFSLTLRMPAPMARSGLKSYFVSRIFRIAPLFYVLLLFSTFRDGQRFGAFPEATKIVANATFVFNFIPGWQTGIVWASWTIHGGV